MYCSEKTKRGPLSSSWREEYKKSIESGSKTGKEMMTSYKLCRVEFKYWGMQTKIERFIHDVGEKVFDVFLHIFFFFSLLFVILVQSLIMN